ncbi:MAG TPA: DUF1194 domain-containing protein [Alphaproteobacteria bacterium]
MLLALALPAAADEVDLQLVLAVDVSGSIDEVEAALQRDGYQKALVHPRVIEAIKSGPTGRIAVTYVEWAGDAFQHTIVEWRVIRDEESARAFVSALAETPIQRERRTSISSAIDYSVARLAASGHVSPRRAIDISGDGYNNIGRDVNAARDEAVRAGITINGLPIINDRPNPFGRPAVVDLDKYYENNVIGGPGAFIVVAKDFNSFAAAILQKLILEISGVSPPGRRVVAEARD